MTVADVLALLNRRVYAGKLEVSWARLSVAAATEVLARHDPLGFCRLGCPADEYEPEAARLVGKLLGFRDDEALWASSPRTLPVATCAETWEACAQAFAELFGEGYGEFVEESLAADLAEALEGAAAGAAPRQEPGAPSRGSPRRA